MEPQRTLSLGLLETTGYTPSMVALDVMTKAADVTVVQTEINDFLGIIIKIVGQTASVHTAIEAGRDVAERMKGKPIANVINSADDQVNPPELGILEREIERVPYGRAVVLPITDETRGHGAHSIPAIWGPYLEELLAESEPAG